MEDTRKKVCDATVLAVRGDKIHISYDGWPSRWNEWVPLSSSRIINGSSSSQSSILDSIDGKITLLLYKHCT